jgi:signal transduction histidine kinase
MRGWLGTIASRLFWLHLATACAATAAMAGAIVVLLNATLTGFERRTLHEHAAAIAAALEPDGASIRLSLPADLRDLYQHGYSGYVFAILDAEGRPLASSRPDGAPLFPVAPRGEAPVYVERRREPNAYFGASYPKTVGGRQVWVQVAQNLDHPDVFVDDVVSQFLARIGWVLAPIVVLLVAADLVIVLRVLDPVRRASHRAETIDPNRLDVRLPAAGLPAEIRPLVAATNRALDRIEAGFRSLREFTSDAAHELRTPLAVMRLRTDALLDQQAGEQLRADIDGMTRLVEQLLIISELETLALSPDERVDLRAIAVDVVSYLAPLAIAKGKDVELVAGGESVWAHGRAEVLARALRNLVENAITHTPPRGSVRVVVGAYATLSVLDEGPGITPAERALIFNPFWRRDRRPASGSGLGLDIVARIVAAHDGAVEVGCAPGGGAAFTIQLRRAPLDTL